MLTLREILDRFANGLYKPGDVFVSSLGIVFHVLNDKIEISWRGQTLLFSIGNNKLNKFGNLR